MDGAAHVRVNDGSDEEIEEISSHQWISADAVQKHARFRAFSRRFSSVALRSTLSEVGNVQSGSEINFGCDYGYRPPGLFLLSRSFIWDPRSF